MKPDLATLRRVPWQHGDGPGAGGPDLAGRHPGRRLAAADPAGADRPAGRARAGRAGRHRAGVHRLRRQLRAGVRPRTTATWCPANQYNVDYSMLGTSRIEPLLRRIRTAWPAPACTSSRPRASATSASTRSRSGTPTRSPPATTTRSTRPARRRSRRRTGMSAHLHGQAEHARGQLLPHPPVAARQRDGGRRSWRRRADGLSPLGEHFLAGQLAALRELTLLLRAEHQLLQAVRARAASPPPRSAGAWTTGPARCGSSGTARRCGWRTGRRAATSTPTSRSPR